MEKHIKSLIVLKSRGTAVAVRRLLNIFAAVLRKNGKEHDTKNYFNLYTLHPPRPADGGTDGRDSRFQHARELGCKRITLPLVHR